MSSAAPRTAATSTATPKAQTAKSRQLLPSTPASASPPARFGPAVAPPSRGKKGASGRTGRRTLSRPGAPAVTAASAADGDATANAASDAVIGSLDEYRQASLRLERVRHGRVHDAERRFLYHARAIRTTYDCERARAEEEFEVGRRNYAIALLRENTEKTRMVEELRYGIMRDDSVSGARKHEMSLRRGGKAASSVGNGSGEDEGFEAAFPGEAMHEEDTKEKPTRRGKKKEDAAKVAAAAKPRLQIQLEEDQIAEDIIALGCQKRPRPEPPVKEDPPARKSKKRKT